MLYVLFVLLPYPSHSLGLVFVSNFLYLYVIDMHMNCTCLCVFVIASECEIDNFDSNKKDIELFLFTTLFYVK